MSDHINDSGLSATPIFTESSATLPDNAANEGDAIAVRFADFGLHPDILRALLDQGYVTPTPIQARAIPIALQGRDMMGAAQTGTGKTAGFTLPILQLLMQYASHSASPARHPVRALILTPTRELADQVAENVRAYSIHTPIRSTVIFGGVDMTPQTAALRSGIEVVIATPGRLLDHVQQKSINLGQTQFFVMDEADRMLDMGFLPDLQRIINLLPAKRQNLMFSATFSPEIKKLAATFLNNPETVEVARNNATSDNITQEMWRVDEDSKTDAVLHLIRTRNLKQVIVFSNTKVGASRLASKLLSGNVKAAAIHGDKTQGERMAALESFKNGEVEVLVATDVAARGLDITDLPCVINVDLPYNAEDYIHRIGRTGRAGASGDAISFFCDKDERLLVDIEKLIRTRFERLPLPGFTGRERQKENREPRDAKDAKDGKEPRNSESRDRSERSERRPAPASGARREKIDPWFLQPYQPSLPTVSSRETTGSLSGSLSNGNGNGSNPDTSRPKRAALLGGLRKQ